MTSITLESIKAEHTRLAEMIATFEKQQATPVFFFPETTITLHSPPRASATSDSSHP